MAHEPLLLVFATLLAGGYATYGLIRHAHFVTGLDLAIFDQAIWHYSRFETPESTILGLPNLLGDHFHPILVALAPLYWVWSDPRALLLAQATLVAASVVPVFLFARARLGRPGAYLLALAYGTFWGLQAGIGYDFHEVAFAPLLIALAILFIDRRLWGAYFVAIGLLLCVKENQALLVCFFGIYLMSLREWKRGAITFAAGAAWYLMVTTIVFPALSPGGTYQHWNYPQFGNDLPAALGAVVREPWRPFEVMFSTGEKVRTMAYLLVPFLGLTFRSRLGILLIPLIAERFLSSSDQFWRPAFHYSMAIAPVLAMGASAGLHNVAASIDPRWRSRVVIGGALGTLVAGTVVTILALPMVPIRQVLRPGFFADPAYARPGRDALTRVPRGASVMTQDALVTHLAHRKLVVEIESRQRRHPDYLVTNVLELVGSPFPPGSYRALQAEVVKRLGYYTPTYYADGWLVARRRGLGGPSTPQTRSVLRPMAPVQAGQLLASLIAWEPARASALSDVSHCSQLTFSRNRGAGACWQRAGAELRKLERRVVVQLATAPASLQGGCRELASATASGVTGFYRDIDWARQAGVLGRKSQLVRARTRLSRDTEQRDLAGRFQRFMALCARPQDIVAAIRRAQHPR